MSKRRIGTSFEAEDIDLLQPIYRAVGDSTELVALQIPQQYQDEIAELRSSVEFFRSKMEEMETKVTESTLGFKINKIMKDMEPGLKRLGEILGAPFVATYDAFKKLGTKMIEAGESIKKSFQKDGAMNNFYQDAKKTMGEVGKAIKDFFGTIFKAAIKIPSQTKKAVLNALDHIDEKVIAPAVGKMHIAAVAAREGLGSTIAKLGASLGGQTVEMQKTGKKEQIQAKVTRRQDQSQQRRDHRGGLGGGISG